MLHACFVRIRACQPLSAAIRGIRKPNLYVKHAPCFGQSVGMRTKSTFYTSCLRTASATIRTLSADREAHVRRQFGERTDWEGGMNNALHIIWTIISNWTIHRPFRAVLVLSPHCLCQFPQKLTKSVPSCPSSQNSHQLHPCIGVIGPLGCSHRPSASQSGPKRAYNGCTQ